MAARNKNSPKNPNLFNIVGLDVRDHADAFIGRLVAVYNFGAGDVIEIADNAGVTFMLPWEFVDKIDKDGIHMSDFSYEG